jgi:hypothetical protein
LRILGLLAILVLIALPFRRILLTEETIFWHDSGPIINYLAIALDNWLRGDIPLWTYTMNAGQPVWPVVEAQLPAYDPLTIVLALPLAAFGLNTHDIYGWLLLGWLTVFLAGSYLLARRLGLNRPLSLFVVIALETTIIVGFPAQPYVFNHARYYPFLILTALLYLRHPSIVNALWLAFTAGLNLSGVNTPYTLMFTLFLLGGMLFSARHRHRAIALLARQHLVPNLTVLVVFLLGALTFIASGIYVTHEAFVVNRLVQPAGWWLDVSRHFNLMAWLAPRNLWHSCVFVGIAGACCALLGTVASLVAIGPLSKRDRYYRFQTRFWNFQWIFFTIMAFEGFVRVYGPDHPGFTMRNWGFFVIYINLALALAAAFSVVFVHRAFPLLIRRPQFWLGVLAMAVLIAVIEHAKSILFFLEPLPFRGSIV